VDTNSRLIWFFEHFNPYFQCGYVVVAALCAALCFWSVIRQFSPGLLLLGIGNIIAVIQLICFIVSAFQDGQPFLPFLPFEVRKQAYLYGRMLGPPQPILFLVTVILLVWEHGRTKDLTNR
jgi:hypothetical protein